MRHSPGQTLMRWLICAKLLVLLFILTSALEYQNNTSLSLTDPEWRKKCSNTRKGSLTSQFYYRHLKYNVTHNTTTCCSSRPDKWQETLRSWDDKTRSRLRWVVGQYLTILLTLAHCSSADHIVRLMFLTCQCQHNRSQCNVSWSLSPHNH